MMSKKWEIYDTDGDLKRKRKSCPKCGPGVFLAEHEDRLSCGNCGYTEFPGKGGSDKEEAPEEEKESKEESGSKKESKEAESGEDKK